MRHMVFLHPNLIASRALPELQITKTSKHSSGILIFLLQTGIKGVFSTGLSFSLIFSAFKIISSCMEDQIVVVVGLPSGSQSKIKGKMP